MKFCKEFNLGFTIRENEFCYSCPLNKGSRVLKREHLSLVNVVPEGLCPFAYFSIIPYWISFVQGAWFRWRKDKNSVICQCPKDNGVVFSVRKANGIVYAEIVYIGKCPYSYSKGQVFKIENINLCPALFPSLFSAIENMDSNEIELGCSISPVSVILERR